VVDTLSFVWTKRYPLYECAFEMKSDVNEQ